MNLNKLANVKYIQTAVLTKGKGINPTPYIKDMAAKGLLVFDEGTYFAGYSKESK